jgi:hypothetical protein
LRVAFGPFVRPPAPLALHAVGKARVSLLSVLPATITPHQSATLCVSASDADELYVSEVGELRPRETTCRTVSPAETTTYVVQATNPRSRATRSITLTVKPSAEP